MSYSRWSNSIWYTYWVATNTKIMDEEVFEICSVRSLTYREIKNDIDAAVKSVADKMRKSFIESNNADLEYLVDDSKSVKDLREYTFTALYSPSEADIVELKGYMQEFLIDIEDEYRNPPNVIIQEKK